MCYSTTFGVFSGIALEKMSCNCPLQSWYQILAPARADGTQTAELGTDMQGQTGRDRESQVSLLHPIYSQCTVPLPPTVQYVCRYMYYNQQYQERLVVSTYTCTHTGLIRNTALTIISSSIIMIWTSWDNPSVHYCTYQLSSSSDYGSSIYI